MSKQFPYRDKINYRQECLCEESHLAMKQSDNFLQPSEISPISPSSQSSIYSPDSWRRMRGIYIPLLKMQNGSSFSWQEQPLRNYLHWSSIQTSHFITGFEGSKVTNERQDDGAGILHHVAPFPIDQVYLYTRHPCPSPLMQGHLWPLHLEQKVWVYNSGRPTSLALTTLSKHNQEIKLTDGWLLCNVVDVTRKKVRNEWYLNITFVQWRYSANNS